MKTLGTIVLLVIFVSAEKLTTLPRGLQGTYYPNTGWSGTPAFSTIDPGVTLHTVRSRRLGFPQKEYSIRWRGWIQVDRSGLYTFTTRSDDGSRLIIDGKKLLDHRGGPPLEVSGTINLEAGFHSIELRYFQGRGKDFVEVYWQPPGQKRTPIPPDVFFPTEPDPQRLLLEKGVHRAALILQWIAPLLLALTVILNRKQIYRAIRQLPSVLRFSRSPFLPFSFFCLLLFAYGLLSWIRSGNGLTGMYYDNLAWRGNPILSLRDTSLSPPSLYKRVAHRLQEPNSLRWVGWIAIPNSTEYSFRIRSDGQVSLSFDGFSALEKGNNEEIQAVSTVLYLTKGLHRIELKYLPSLGLPHTLEVSWSHKGSRAKAIPGDILFQERPSARSLFFRNLTSWAYRGVQILSTVFLGTLCLFVLFNQKSLFDRLVRTSTFQALSRQVQKRGPIRALFQRTWTHLGIILGVTLLVVFNNLGRGSLITTDLDEGAYTWIAQTMVETGEWWSPPPIGGVPLRPPLKYWLSALTFSLLGDTEFFVRVWDAVFGLFTFILLYFFGAHLFSSKTVGLLSALILLGCKDFISNHGVRAGVLDSLLVFFFVLSLFLFHLRGKRVYFYYLAGLSMGLGALTKSFQGLIPLVIIILYLILTQRWEEFKTIPFLGMVFLALLVPAVWYVPQAFLRPDLFKTVILQDLVQRVQGKIHTRHVQGPFFYFQVIYQGFFPWSLVVPPAIGVGFWQAIRRGRREMGFLLIWILTIFVGFSLSKMKVIWYMHPLYPALAMLLAAAFYSFIKVFRGSQTYPLLSPLGIGLLVSLLASSLYANYERALEQPRKLPVHLFTDYLADLKDQDYRVVFYNLQTWELPYESRYYLNRVKDRLIWTRDINTIEQLYRRQRPLFVILRITDYETQPLFREHFYSRPLTPAYARGLYPKKQVLVYNQTPDSKWFVKNPDRSS